MSHLRFSLGFFFATVRQPYVPHSRSAYFDLPPKLYHNEQCAWVYDPWQQRFPFLFSPHKRQILLLPKPRRLNITTQGYESWKNFIASIVNEPSIACAIKSRAFRRKLHAAVINWIRIRFNFRLTKYGFYTDNAWNSCTFDLDAKLDHFKVTSQTILHYCNCIFRVSRVFFCVSRNLLIIL